jgi:hypothetical protein
MSVFKTDVVYKVVNEAKNGSLETGNLYFMNVPVTYAKVLAPAKKYQQDDTAYQLNVFINADTMTKLEDIGINKEFAEVGVTKIKKGANRGKVKYPADVEANTPYVGMFAAQLGRDTVKRDKNGAVVKEYAPLKLLDDKGQPFSDEVGNGSVCHVKAFAYRNTDGMLVVMVDTVVVVNHVPYVRGDGEVFDDVLGISIKTEPKAESVIEDSPLDASSEATEPVKEATNTKVAAKSKEDVKAPVEVLEDDMESPF